MSTMPAKLMPAQINFLKDAYDFTWAEESDNYSDKDGFINDNEINANHEYFKADSQARIAYCLLIDQAQKSLININQIENKEAAATYVEREKEIYSKAYEALLKIESLNRSIEADVFPIIKDLEASRNAMKVLEEENKQGSVGFKDQFSLFYKAVKNLEENIKAINKQYVATHNKAIEVIDHTTLLKMHFTFIAEQLSDNDKKILDPNNLAPCNNLVMLYLNRSAGFVTKLEEMFKISSMAIDAFIKRNPKLEK